MNQVKDQNLVLNNIVYEGCNLLEEGNINVTEIPTLWMFANERMDEYVQRKLITYIEDGGQLVMFPVIPMKDMNGESCTLLKEYINVEIKVSTDAGFVKLDDVDSVKINRMEKYGVSTGDFGWSEDEDHSVVDFEKRLGNGKLVMFGVSMEFDYQYKKEIYRNLASKIGVKSSFTIKDELDISTRVLEDGGSFVYVNNFDEFEKVTSIIYNDKQLFGGKEITVPGKGGLMLPVNIELIPGLTILYGTAEFTEIIETEHKVSIAIKMKQNKEEILLKSKYLRPQENSKVQVVENTSDGNYKVIISSLKEHETIDFI